MLNEVFAIQCTTIYTCIWLEAFGTQVEACLIQIVTLGVLVCLEEYAYGTYVEARCNTNCAIWL